MYSKAYPANAQKHANLNLRKFAVIRISVADMLGKKTKVALELLTDAETL